MTRHDQINAKWFDDEVQKVFLDGCTSFEERVALVEKWCAGDYECYVTLAHAKGLLPAALIVGALVDVEHPLLVQGGFLVCKSLFGCSVLVIQVEFSRKPVHMIVVDRLLKSSGQVALVHMESGRPAV